MAATGDDEDDIFRQFEEELLGDSNKATVQEVAPPKLVIAPSTPVENPAVSLAAPRLDTQSNLPATESDDFFDDLMNDKLATGSTASGQLHGKSEIGTGCIVQASRTPLIESARQPVVVATYALDDGDDDEFVTPSPACSQLACDATIPDRQQKAAAALAALPDAPSDFTSEDRVLRYTLLDFYAAYNTQNIANVDAIVRKYRGANLSHLWVQLSLKYGIDTHVATELLSRTLYPSAPFEYVDEALAERLDREASELRKLAGDGRGRSEVASAMFRLALERGVNDGDDAMLRYLCFRGVPDEGQHRSLVWQVLLGYLPLQRHSEWNAIRGHKRALYAGYRYDFLTKRNDGRLTSRDHEDPSVSSQTQELLQEIQNDVSRTRRDTDFFRRNETSEALLAVLFVYARLNPGVRYVQGMNEVAAVLLFVMAAASSGKVSLDEDSEADTFWCFGELMSEIKEGFMQSMDNSAEGTQAMANSVTHLLKAYDFDVARHLQRCELPSVVWAFRWCTLLFAQDFSLADILRLWDSFIADPLRYSFVVHVAVAAVVLKREELLSSDKQFALAEALQSAPRDADVDTLMRRSWAICAFERRKQSPPFPQRSSLQTVEDITELAQTAVARAQEVGDEVRRNIQEHIAPVVIERAGQASIVAAAAAQDSAQALQTWLEDTAPARQQALSHAQTQLTSLWDVVKAKGSVALSKGQGLAAEYSQPNAEGTAAPIAAASTAAAAANNAASAVTAHAASAWAAASAAWVTRGNSNDNQT